MPIAAAKRESPEAAKAPQDKQQKAKDDQPEKRPRLSLPPAQASLSSVKATIVPFSSKRDQPSYIAAILGGKDRVWLLETGENACPGAGSSLYESDGRHIRLVSRSICANLGCFSPTFDALRLRGNTLELLGTSGGGCGVQSAWASRDAGGPWRCDGEPGARDEIQRFWSSGALYTVKQFGGGVEIDLDHAASKEAITYLSGKLSPRQLPIAVAKGAVHALALARGEGDDVMHLVEWTGMRWRERADILPVGISAEDIDAVTVDDEGTYYATSHYALLIFDGKRFVARSIPPGFSSELLVASKGYGLWALGGGRAWHYEPPAWTYVELPMAHVSNEWLAPSGTLWIAGSHLATADQPESNGATNAVVVTLPLSRVKQGWSP